MTAPPSTLPGHYGLGFRGGIDLERRTEGTVVLSKNRPVCLLRRLHPQLHSALERITARPLLLSELMVDLDAALQEQLVSIVLRLRGLLHRSVMHDTRELLRIQTPTVDFALAPVTVTPQTLVRLSRFTLLRATGHHLALESARTEHQCLLTDPAATALVTTLAEPVPIAQLPAPDLPNTASTSLVRALAELGFVDLGEMIDDQVRFAADDDDVLAQWEFHDLLFHERSRVGHPSRAHDEPFPFLDLIAPQPVARSMTDAPVVELHHPTLAELLATDPALTTALEGRRSVRSYGQQPITAPQVGEFLYRVARVRATYGPDRTVGLPYEGSSRPYPSGGSCYDLELYLVIGRCRGIAEAIYFYDPVGHRLHLVNDDQSCRDELLDAARRSMAADTPPDILIAVTSRFHRVAWKYPSIAYRLTTQHVGVLYQNMYLVATAMGLAPCAIGDSSADLVSGALGLRRLCEPVVGAFLLGSLPTEKLGSTTDQGSAVGWWPVNDPHWSDEAQRLLRQVGRSESAVEGTPSC
ncbi:SagB-type dehydrogenase domain-containing protein [Longimycelium tulufanense]|uniref:SagB-type dehydrogenase domain-containing protein n=1 Tax=Longimycelium tulufanense TaxID=907463 RepID=A0A8J3CEJ6_9PSEU|nr:SagB family peptide dehydrogenase [Longimycelium tulufanense]GGM48887.1 SagB-type dehydrogenase domain-containing protein [Longimycelium tulufanense]